MTHSLAESGKQPPRRSPRGAAQCGSRGLWFPAPGPKRLEGEAHAQVYSHLGQPTWRGAGPAAAGRGGAGREEEEEGGAGGGGREGAGRSRRGGRAEARGGVCKLSLRGHCGKQPWSEAGTSPVSRTGSFARLSPSSPPRSSLARGDGGGCPATMVSAGERGGGADQGGRVCARSREAPAAPSRARGRVGEQPRPAPPVPQPPGPPAPVVPAPGRCGCARGARDASLGLSGTAASFITPFAERLVCARRGARRLEMSRGPGGVLAIGGLPSRRTMWKEGDE